MELNQAVLIHGVASIQDNSPATITGQNENGIIVRISCDYLKLNSKRLRSILMTPHPVYSALVYVQEENIEAVKYASRQKKKGSKNT